MVKVVSHHGRRRTSWEKRERVTDDTAFRLDVSAFPRAEPHGLNTSRMPVSQPCYSGIMSPTHAF